MTAATVVWEKDGFSGDLKIRVVKFSDGAAALTYDTNMDATDARGSVFKEIFSTWVSDPTSGTTPAAYSNSTGIITLPTGTVATSYLHIVGI